MIWPAVRAAIYAGLGAAELAADVYGRVKRIGRALLPRRREDAFPLTHAASERQAQFARCAGHELEPRCATIRPPPPDAQGRDKRQE